MSLKQITIKEALELQGYQFCKKCISFHKKKDPCIPLDMEEFLWARGKSLLAETIRKKFQSRQPLPAVLHTEALNLYQEYLICGGMPAVVAAEPFRAAEIKQFIYKAE